MPSEPGRAGGDDESRVLYSGPPGVRVERSARRVLLDLPEPRRTCGSAPLGGGLTRARTLCILRVDADRSDHGRADPPPEDTLLAHCRRQGRPGPYMGMMTAASMDSCRVVRRGKNGLDVLAALTAGVSNARRAGDRADVLQPDGETPPAGTINIIAVTNADLADEAMVEAIMIMTEAKAAVLGSLGVASPVSGLPATGTGTDCAAVVCGTGPRLRWCGKHVLLGELLAGAVMEALVSSLGPGS